MLFGLPLLALALAVLIKIDLWVLIFQGFFQQIIDQRKKWKKQRRKSLEFLIPSVFEYFLINPPA